MGYRCPECNLLCGVEHGEPELVGEERREEKGVMYVSAEVRLVLLSTCCSAEIAEANLEFTDLEIALAHNHPRGKFRVIDTTFLMERKDRYEGRERGQRHFYGVTVTVNLACSCGWSNSNSAFLEEQASSFETLA